MFVAKKKTPQKSRVTTPTSKIAKAEDNPLEEAMQGRPPAERVRSSVSRLTDRERMIYQSVQEAIRALGRSADAAFVRRLITDGVDRMLNGISLADFVQELRPMVDAITNEVTAAGGRHVSHMSAQIGGGMRFDYLDPRALQWANQRAGAFVSTLLEDQRNSLRQIISQGVADQLTVDQIAVNVRDVIGLHENWAEAVPKARAREFAKLVAQGMSSQVAAQRAEVFAGRYRDRLVRARAKTIARTEIMTAQNQGRWLSWAQMSEQGYIPKNAKKEWIAAPGFGPAPKLCEVCAQLDGKKAPWDQAFPGTDVMMPPLHPNCRCTAVIVPFDMEEVQQVISVTDEQYGIAGEYLDRVRQVEPEVTNELVATAKRMGGDMIGLDYRVKTRNSLARKMMSDVQESGGELSARQALAEINDALRYTIRLDNARYSDEVYRFLIDADTRGLLVKSKIRWSEGDSYRGVNAVLKHPKTGQMYELQFHTQGSLNLKDKNHPLYERHRRMRPDNPEKDSLNQQMIGNAESVELPDKIDRLSGLIFG